MGGSAPAEPRPPVHVINPNPVRPQPQPQPPNLPPRTINPPPRDMGGSAPAEPRPPTRVINPNPVRVQPQPQPQPPNLPPRTINPAPTNRAPGPSESHPTPPAPHGPVAPQPVRRR
jgi:hypothetical protein